MPFRDITKNILSELRAHAPFTIFGAFTGIICMLLFKNISHEANQKLFTIFHPCHVVLSAMVTASLFRLYEKKTSFLIVLLVGYIGSIGIATLSDSVIPFLGESILGVSVPAHSEHPLHAEEHTEKTAIEEEHHKLNEHDESIRHRIHIGFIEDWYIVNPAAILGVLLAFFLPHTKFPHAGHVLISTWASSFHVLMNTHSDISTITFIGIFIVLFLAVWLPCCVSDIVFPMLFVKSGEKPLHSH
ncbi:MAG: hypothetical protein KAS69_06720 [Planctomycetes bacterium]|nr:hypothetical protein [Planctomycetota bacterium]